MCLCRRSPRTSSKMIVGAVDDAGRWQGEFDTTRAPWVTGVFEGAVGAVSFAPTLYVRHTSTSCSSNTGRFTVNDVAIDPDGVLTALSIDFEQRCDGATAPLFGGLRYNSNVPLVYAMSVTPSTTVDRRRLARDLHRHRVVCARRSGGTGLPSSTRRRGSGPSCASTPRRTRSPGQCRLPAPMSLSSGYGAAGYRASYEWYVNGPPVTVR